MHRRKFLQNSAFTAGLLSLQPSSLIAALFQEGWKIKMLSPQTGIFTERGGAILFTMADDGIVVVDSQFPAQAGHLIDELKKTQQKPFSLLINTHHHGDHSGGNIAFKGIVKELVAHKNSLTNQQRQAAQRKNEDQQFYPTLTFEDKWCKNLGTQEICLHYFGAGHTNGDVVVHLQKENILHMGDLCFKHIYPNIDASAGASMKNWMLVLDKVYQLADKDTRVICSHGNPADDVVVNREFLKEQQFFFEKVMSFVAAEKKNGKTLEQLLNTTVIPGVDKWKANGFVKPNITVAYNEL